MDKSDGNGEYLKKILKEADAEVGDLSSASMLNILLKNSSNLQAEAQPPVGYEAQLLKSLKAQLPLPQVAQQAEKGGVSASLMSDLFSFLRSPQMSWSVSGVLAVFIAVFFSVQYAHVSTNGMDSNSVDLLSQTASRGGDEVSGDWLASVGDAGIRAKTTRSLSSLADELESRNDKAAVDRALNEVAQQMGMKKL